MRAWFEVRDSIERASLLPMRAVTDGETTVENSPFALRLAMENDTTAAVKVKVNITVPLLCQIDPLDWESMNEGDRSPTLPTAGSPAERWLIATREIMPGDVAVVDVKVEVAAIAECPCDFAIRGVVGQSSINTTGDEIEERIVVSFGAPAA